MNKRKMLSRLGTQLTMATLCCALAAGLLFTALSRWSYHLLDDYLMDEAVTKRREEAYAGKIQSFVTKEKLAIGQVKELDQCLEKERYLYAVLYYQNKTIYSSDGKTAYDTEELELEESPPDLSEAFTIEFADGTAHAVLYCFFEFFYYSLADGICAFISAAIFVLLLFLCIHRKMRYIELIEQEVKILKSGDLSCPITVKGKDELATLAAEMNAMRCAIKEKIEKEEETRQANRELVTAMSHDLRTPLTSLLGYVDLLCMEKIHDRRQKERYLESIRQKAYQLKTISDKLFEYFIVYGQDQETLCPEEVNGMEFLGQVVEESLFDLESEGFQISRISDEISCHLMADINLVRRVFGNIFSNLLKYGDSRYPVEVIYRQMPENLIIIFTNHISPDTAKGESSGIGLKTCQKIMELHGGHFLFRKDETQFTVEIVFPL